MHANITESNEGVKRKGVKEGKFLTFELDGEEYGGGDSQGEGNYRIMNITSVPQTPCYVKGVINLRGKVIPVIDLRLKFGMDTHGYDERTCIIVIDIADHHGRSIVMGIVVDSVSEVLNIRQEDIEETTTFSVDLNMGFILGMAKVKGNVKILLDIDKVLGAEEVAVISSVMQ